MFTLVVPRERLELSRCRQQRILSPPRLPVPPPRQLGAKEWAIVTKCIFLSNEKSSRLLRYAILLRLQAAIYLRVNGVRSCKSCAFANRSSPPAAPYSKILYKQTVKNPENC